MVPASLLNALFLRTLWMKVMASAWVQFSRDRPLTSSISSQTSRSALSAGDPENITNSVSNYMYHFYNIQKAHGHHCSPEKQFLAINRLQLKATIIQACCLKIQYVLMRGSRGGGGGVRTPPDICILNIADITGNEKLTYFPYLCTSTVIRQTESIHKITIKKLVFRCV